MCVIVYKPAGQPMPGWDTLKDCWRANPHGAGFMRPDGGSVRILKGFMEWGDFEGALAEELGCFDTVGTPVAMHFRIATHGAVKPGCCHPFPVCSSASAMRATEQTAQVGFMHNGILDGLRTSETVSDSMAFDKGVLAPLSALVQNIVGDERVQRIVGASAQGSRFLLMDGSGRVETFGRWVACDGILFSNDRFMARFPPARYREPAGEGGQLSLFDAYRAFSGIEANDLTQLGLYPACESCGQVEECVEIFPCCYSEADARLMAALA